MLLCQKHAWRHFSTVLGYKNLKHPTSNGMFLFEDLQFSMCCQCWKLAQMHGTNWFLWHESMVSLLLEIPPPSKNSAKLILAPGSWLPKRTGYAWAGLIAESSWATRLAVPKLKLTGWCHGTGVLKIIHIEGRSRPPQGKGVSKRKSVRRVKNDYEVFSDRKIMVVFSGKAGGNWGGLFWSLTPHERHCFGLPDSDRKKTAAASTKKWFPCEVFFPQQISAVSKVRNEKCY